MPDLSPARFYAILDTGYVAADRWEETCRQLIAGGADLVQLRAKNETRDERRRLLEAVLPLFEPDPSGPPPPHLIINDDLDLCLEYPGLGLHVGQDDVPVEEARRRLGSNRLLGLSTHSIEQAERAIAHASHLDYFAVGPIFATPTKPDYGFVGLELVPAVARLHPPLPFFAIGGIKRDNIRDVLAAGGRRIVVVSDVLCDPDPEGTVRAYRRLLS